MLLALSVCFVLLFHARAAIGAMLGGEMGNCLLFVCGSGNDWLFPYQKKVLAMRTGKRGPACRIRKGMGTPTTCSRKTFPLSIRRRIFCLTQPLCTGNPAHREGSSLRGGGGSGKTVCFPFMILPVVVLGPGNGCNVLYDKNYQVLAKFAGSMEHADLMFLWLLQREIPIVNAPAGWHSPDKDNPEPEPVKSSVLRRQFVLRMKRSTGIGFAVIGCFMLLLGLALFLAVFLLTDVSALPMVDRCALVFLEAEMGMGIVSLRIGKVSRVEVDGEQMRVVSRFGRAAEFSVRDVSSVSRSLGWIVLYNREFKTLAKVDSYLEDMERLKEYMASYGIKM